MWSNHQWQLIQTSLIHSYLLKIIILICHVQSTSTLIQWHHLLDIFVVFLISGMYTISSQNCPSLIIHLESSVSEVALWIHVQIQYCSLAIQRLGSYKLNSFKDPCDYPESMSHTNNDKLLITTSGLVVCDAGNCCDWFSCCLAEFSLWHVVN